MIVADGEVGRGELGTAGRVRRDRPRLRPARRRGGELLQTFPAPRCPGGRRRGESQGGSRPARSRPTADRDRLRVRRCRRRDTGVRRETGAADRLPARRPLPAAQTWLLGGTARRTTAILATQL